MTFHVTAYMASGKMAGLPNVWGLVIHFLMIIVLFTKKENQTCLTLILPIHFCPKMLSAYYVCCINMYSMHCRILLPWYHQNTAFHQGIHSLLKQNNLPREHYKKIFGNYKPVIPRYIEWTIPCLLYQTRRKNPLVYTGKVLIIFFTIIIFL